MRNLYILFYFILFLFIDSCRERSIQPKANQRTVEEIKIDENDHLQILLDQFKIDNVTNGRSTSILNEIDLDIALKKTDTLTGMVQYAFSITDGKDKILQNFILTELPDHTLFGHVFIYEVDSAWLEEVEHFPGWDKYTGTFTITDLEGNVIAENAMRNGTSLEGGKQANGRINGSICYSTTWEVTVSSKYGSYTYYETETNCVTYSSTGDTQIGGIPPEPAPLIMDDDEEPTPIVSKISLNIDDQGYDELTSCEKELVKVYTGQAYIISENRNIAHQKTIEIFGPYQNGNGHNDCADAFRHAFFNAINTKSVGAAVAKLFGDAHECDTSAGEIKEKEMDLFNNSIGRAVALESPNASTETLAALILVDMEVGNLRYLSPLGNYNMLVFNSQLVSTSKECIP